MLLVVKPSFLFDNTTYLYTANDDFQSTAIGLFTFSALFCQSNTFVLERKLKGNELTLFYHDDYINLLLLFEALQESLYFRSSRNYTNDMFCYIWFSIINNNVPSFG